MKYFSAVLLIACLIVSGCSLTAPRNVGKSDMVTLPSLSSAQMQTPPQKKFAAIMVSYPTAPSDLDTFRIAVLRADGRQDYFSGTRWAAFLPSVVQSALQDTLLNSNAFSYVESDEGSIAGRYILNTEIHEFGAVYTSSSVPPSVILRVSFNLQHARNLKPLTEFTLEEKAQAQKNDKASIAAAYTEAFTALEQDIVKRIFDTLGKTR